MQAAGQQSSSVGKEREGKGGAEELRRKTAQRASTTAEKRLNAIRCASASTTVKEAAAKNAAVQASASTTEEEAGARYAAGRASANTTVKEGDASYAVD